MIVINFLSRFIKMSDDLKREFLTIELEQMILLSYKKNYMLYEFYFYLNNESSRFRILKEELLNMLIGPRMCFNSDVRVLANEMLNAIEKGVHIKCNYCQKKYHQTLLNIRRILDRKFYCSEKCEKEDNIIKEISCQEYECSICGKRSHKLRFIKEHVKIPIMKKAQIGDLIAGNSSRPCGNFSLSISSFKKYQVLDIIINEDHEEEIIVESGNNVYVKQENYIILGENEIINQLRMFHLSQGILTELDSTDNLIEYLKNCQKKQSRRSY